MPDMFWTCWWCGGVPTPRPVLQVALNWTICKGAVPIPGAKNATQAASNAGALGWRLTPAEVELLDEVAIQGRLKLGQCG